MRRTSGSPARAALRAGARLFALLLLLAPVMHAQPGATAELVITVRHAVTGAPIAGARVVVDVVRLATDSAGTVRTQVAAGEHRVTARAIGHAPAEERLFVGAGERREVVIALAALAQRLDSVVTLANAENPRLRDFERRRSSGGGHYITRTEIEQSQKTTLADVLRLVRGVRVLCRTTCTAQFVRSLGCDPLYFIDGFPTGADLLDMPIGDVGGVELYRGASEVPAEFLRDGASCGVIAISSWVPPRPRKP